MYRLAHPGHCPAQPAHGGFTLVETLVAALVLGFGVLGTALLFLHGVHANGSALLRSQAVELASDLGERIRANAAGRAAYALEALTAAHVAPACAVACTAAARAASDLGEWLELLAARLPAPRDGSAPARVGFEAGNPPHPDRYRIRIAWSDPHGDAVWHQELPLDLPPALAP
jgi:type IV pilus assembly protein PilV